MASSLFEGYVFIIDTDSYSGNFEREMCAYITGRLEEYEIGEEYEKIALDELKEEEIKWFKDNIDYISDDDSCVRPYSLWETPGWFNDGYGTYWRNGSDMEEVRRVMIEKKTKFYLENIKREQEFIDDGDKRWEEKIKNSWRELETIKDMKAGKFNAYLSVAIFFSVKPPSHIIELMKKRANKFVSEVYDGGWKKVSVNIEGYRLIKFYSKSLYIL